MAVGEAYAELSGWSGNQVIELDGLFVTFSTASHNFQVLCLAYDVSYIYTPGSTF
jgi:hypothetical protein